MVNAENYSILGDYAWWTHISNGLDMFISGVMGGFIEIGNAVIPHLLNRAIKVSSNIVDIARFVVNNRIAIGYWFTFIFGSVAKFKDWVATPITYDEAGQAMGELAKDVFQQLIVTAPIAGVVNLWQWGLPERVNHALNRIGLAGGSAFLTSFANTLSNGAIIVIDTALDDKF